MRFSVVFYRLRGCETGNYPSLESVGNHCVFSRFAIDQFAFGPEASFLCRFLNEIRCFFSVSAKILSLDGAFGPGAGAFLGVPGLYY